MKRVLLALLLLTIVPAGSAAGGERFACNMNTLTKSERVTHHKLSRALLEKVREKTELPNGYAFRLPSAAFLTTAQWVSLERKCCPFFTFELELAGDADPLWLRITGSEGIKPFILAEFGLEASP